jgi:hypothetical protein
MASIKQVVYRYNGDPNTEEPLVDYDDEIPIPNKDDVIQRNGASWKVIQVSVTQGVTLPKPIDVYRIFLQEVKAKG